MSFENRAEELRQPIPWDDNSGGYPHWVGTWEAFELANINDGIAEILAALAAGARSAETRETAAQSEGRQSGGLPQRPTHPSQQKETGGQ